MYYLIQQCLLFNDKPIIVKQFKSKKHATKLKHQLHRENNTHPVYRVFKYRVVKSEYYQLNIKG